MKKAQVAHRDPMARYVANVIKKKPGITTQQLADAVGIDYVNNFNKRAARIYRTISRWVWRKKIGQRHSWFIREKYTKLSQAEFSAMVKYVLEL